MGVDASVPESGHDVTSGSSDNNSHIPLVFLKETAIFGDRKPTRAEWIGHEEMYKAIANRIEGSHITGLQRVRGLWRIYVDSLEDKVKLMTEGVSIRGKSVSVLNTNPQRLDNENTVRIRIKIIPLSADDRIITRGLTLRGLDVIKLYREKLRINGRLTNCENGDRIAIVKALSLKEPLPYTVAFSSFMARVIHVGQKTGIPREVKCSKCLQSGHKANECSNEWVCRKCNKPGHKQSECDTGVKSDSESDSESTLSDTEQKTDTENPSKSTETQKQPKVDKRQSVKAKQRSTSQPGSRQQSMDRFINMRSTDNSPSETPNKDRPRRVIDRSPPTPVELLQDKTTKKNNKRHK